MEVLAVQDLPPSLPGVLGPQIDAVADLLRRLGIPVSHAAQEAAVAQDLPASYLRVSRHERQRRDEEGPGGVPLERPSRQERLERGQIKSTNPALFKGISRVENAVRKSRASALGIERKTPNFQRRRERDSAPRRRDASVKEEVRQPRAADTLDWKEVAGPGDDFLTGWSDGGKYVDRKLQPIRR